MIKVGLIGYGYAAKTFHLPLIETSECLDFIAINTSQPDSVKKKYPDVSIFDRAEDLISSGLVDLIIITAPNHVHYSLAKLCLNNGAHVVIEKPMVTTSNEAKELQNLANEKSLLLSVFHNRRWDGDFLTVKRLIDHGTVGNLRVFESHFDRYRPTVRQRWREVPGSGAGNWFDLGSHLVDQAICLFGLPDSLTARCLALRDKSETTDYFHVLLHYDKFEVLLHASPFTSGPKLRFRLEGTKGSFLKYDFDPQESQLKDGMLSTDVGYGSGSIETFGTLYSEAGNTIIATEVGCYQEYYSGICRAIMGKGVPPVSCEDALRVIKILELAELSSISGVTKFLSEM